MKKPKYLSGLTTQNDRLNDKGKNVNSSMKRKHNVEKMFADNMNINVGMLNKSGLHLNDCRTTRPVNNKVLHLLRHCSYKEGSF